MRKIQITPLYRLHFLMFLSPLLIFSGQTKEDPPSAGLHSSTLTVNHRQRKFLVYVPSSYDPNKKYPVVMMFHGGGGNAEASMEKTGWHKKADKEGFLAVFPEGSPPYPSRPPRFMGNPQTWNDGSKRPSVWAAENQIEDIEFVSALLDKLSQKYAVDEKRIYATGFSNGAAMSFRISRELSDRIAAIAPVSGSDWLQDLKPTRPVPLIYITGTADPLNPIEGGEIHIGRKSYGNKTPTSDIVDQWVSLHNLPEKGKVIFDQDGTTATAYGAPDQPPKVVIYILKDHGHYWSDSPTDLPSRIAGKNVSTLNTTDVIWDFFNTQSLPEKSDATENSLLETEKPLPILSQ